MAVTDLYNYSCFHIIFYLSLFWCNPIKDSEIHALDLYFACISIIVVSAYACLYKHMNIPFLISFLLMLYFFYISNTKSSIEWCCFEHIYYHVISHIFVFLSMMSVIFLCAEKQDVKNLFTSTGFPPMTIQLGI